MPVAFWRFGGTEMNERKRWQTDVSIIYSFNYAIETSRVRAAGGFLGEWRRKRGGGGGGSESIDDRSRSACVYSSLTSISENQFRIERGRRKERNARAG